MSGAVERKLSLQVQAGAARRLDGPPGAQVGVHVGAPERIDGLLGVADDGQHVAARAVEEDPPEDRPLHLVGVLELVDERVAVAGAQGGQQGPGARRPPPPGSGRSGSTCPGSRTGPPRACAPRAGRPPAAAAGPPPRPSAGRPAGEKPAKARADAGAPPGRRRSSPGARARSRGRRPGCLSMASTVASSSGTSPGSRQAAAASRSSASLLSTDLAVEGWTLRRASASLRRGRVARRRQGPGRAQHRRLVERPGPQRLRAGAGAGRTARAGARSTARCRRSKPMPDAHPGLEQAGQGRVGDDVAAERVGEGDLEGVLLVDRSPRRTGGG